MENAELRYIRDVLGVSSILRIDQGTPVAQESWELAGSTTSGLAWVRSRRPQDSLLQGELYNLVSKMTQALKADPGQTAFVECSKQDIDEVISTLSERGVRFFILCGDDFEPYLSAPQGQLKSIHGTQVLRILDPAQLLANESLKRPVWEDLKKILAARSAT